MTEQNKQRKLFGKKQVLLAISATLCGLGLFAYRNYVEKGHLDRADIFSAVVAGIFCAILLASMAWHANKPEKP